MALPEEQMAAIDNIAAKQMGVAPATPQQEPAPQEPPSTPQEAASKEMSPTTEGDNVVAEAVMYEIEDSSGNKRQYTPQQITATMDRYRDLNYKHAQAKPLMAVIEKLQKANPGMSNQDIASALDNVIRGGTRNPTMGNVKGEKSGDSQVRKGPDGDIQAQLKNWETENAATLPPGYEQLLSSQAQLNQDLQMKLQRQEQMLQQVLAQSEGVAQAARDGVVDAQTTKVDSIKQTIANNLDRAQQQLGLPDEAVNDFLIFSAERGYTMEDFVDPGLTNKIARDFKNSMDSDEMATMRNTNQRRMAYTGSLGSSPSGQQGAGEPTGDSTFDKLSSGIMSQRGIG